MHSIRNTDEKLEVREKVIVTHNGIFHCDEVFAAFMLTNHTKEFKYSKIIRSRKKEDWLKADALLDVGCEFNLEKRQFDHHQNTFNETFSEHHSIKLSTAGIIFKYFGKEIIVDILDNLCKEKQCSNKWTSKEIDEIYNYVYSELFENIDAMDNGISQYENTETPKYRVTTHLSCRVSRMNLSWNEKNNNDLEMKNFEIAMKMCGEELVSFIDVCAFSYLPAKNIVQTAVLNREKVHESGQIIEMPSFCPWTDHLFQIEKQLISQNFNTKPILFAIIAANNEFCVRAVPLSPKSFDLRKPLKDTWRGVPDAQIELLSGIKGLKFVHASGFIGGAKTREAALALAVQSLFSN